MIDKVARSRRKNPIQESIVSKKDVLNERTSKLIDLLIDTKRGWNGKPSPDIGLSQKTPISQPLPREVIKGIDNSQQLLTSIVQLLKTVQQEQDNYSKQVAEKQKESSFDDENSLIKESSSIISRIISHIKAPFSSEKNRWERLGILRGLARLEQSLKIIDEKILSSDPDSVLDAIELSKELYIDSKSVIFNTVKESTLLNIKEIKKLIDELKEIETKETETKKIIEKPVEKLEEKPAEKPQSIKEVALQSLKKPQSEVSPEVPKSTKEPSKPAKEPSKITNIKFLKNLIEEIIKFIFQNITEMSSEINNKIQKIESLHGKYFGEFNDIIQAKELEYYQSLESIKILIQNPPSLPSENNFLRVYKENCIDRYLSFCFHQMMLSSFLDSFQESVKNPSFKLNDSKNVTLAKNFKKTQNKKLNEFIDSITNKLEKTSLIEYENFEKTASSWSRWVDRLKINLSSTKNKNLILLVDRSIHKLMKSINDLMNVLEEKDFGVKKIHNQMINVWENMQDMFDKLADLAIVYNSNLLMEKSKLKQQKQRISFDFIKESDISMLKRFSKEISENISNIKKLFELEDEYEKVLKENKIKETKPSNIN